MPSDEVTDLILAGEYATVIELGREEAERRGLRLEECPKTWDFAFVDTSDRNRQVVDPEPFFDGFYEIVDHDRTRTSDGWIIFHLAGGRSMALPPYACVKVFSGPPATVKSRKLGATLDETMVRSNRRFQGYTFEEMQRECLDAMAKMPPIAMPADFPERIARAMRELANDPNYQTDMSDE